MKPVAIDLFCGLGRKPQLGWRANALVQELVTGRTEYPNHLAATVGHQAPGTVALVPRPMRNLQDARLSASLAGSRKVRILATEPLLRSVRVRTARVVDFLDAGFAFVKSAALCLRALGRACGGAIALVAIGRRDAEVFAAHTTVATGGSYVVLLATSAPTNARLTFRGAVEFVRALGLKCGAAIDTKQIVHGGIMP